MSPIYFPSRQVELSFTRHDSSCLLSMLIFIDFIKYPVLNSTLKGLTACVNPFNTEFSLQYGIYLYMWNLTFHSSLLLNIS